MIPVAARPRSDELPTPWRGEEAACAPWPTSTRRPADAANTARAVAAGPRDLFTSTPTLFGRVYNSFYCDGTQGRDTSRCEVLSDADPYKLGVLTP